MGRQEITHPRLRRGSSRVSTGTTWFREAIPTLLHPFPSELLLPSSHLWTTLISPKHSHLYPSSSPSNLLAPGLCPQPVPHPLLLSAHLSEPHLGLGRGLLS